MKKTTFEMAMDQMANLGRELLVDRVCEYSKLYRTKDGELRSDDERRAVERLRYNEIAATANVIKLFTGREISFQWARGANNESFGGFVLYEIMEDVPCDEIPGGVSGTTYSRYSGQQEPDKRIRWDEGREQGKIVKLYELIYDVNANPCYVGGYQ